jgi:hypothetical protein
MRTENKEPKIYKSVDVNSEIFKKRIEEAKKLWNEAARIEFEKHGDTGSCIVCDGIQVEFLPPRCRKPIRLTIIPSREVAWCQGSLHYEATKQVALDYLKQHGIDCFYNYGRMD